MLISCLSCERVYRAHFTIWHYKGLCCLWRTCSEQFLRSHPDTVGGFASKGKKRKKKTTIISIWCGCEPHFPHCSFRMSNFAHLMPSYITNPVTIRSKVFLRYSEVLRCIILNIYVYKYIYICIIVDMLGKGMQKNCILLK